MKDRRWKIGDKEDQLKLRSLIVLIAHITNKQLAFANPMSQRANWNYASIDVDFDFTRTVISEQIIRLLHSSKFN